MTGGGYRLSQDAARQEELYFRTAGARKQGKYLTTGSFMFHSLSQDSVGNTLRYGLHNSDPYQFFAVAKGNWKITQYDLRAAISRPFMQDKLIAGMGATYKVGNAWRSNDPRVRQFIYDLTAQATLHYCFLPGHS